jgi:hypothetical protein
MSFSGYYCIDFRVIRRRSPASVEIVAADNKIYRIPLSHISPLDRNVKAGDRDGSLSVTEWFAKKEGWISDAA